MAGRDRDRAEWKERRKTKIEGKKVLHRYTKYRATKESSSTEKKETHGCGCWTDKGQHAAGRARHDGRKKGK